MAGPYYWGVQLHLVSGAYLQRCVGFDSAAATAANAIAEAHSIALGNPNTRPKDIDDPTAKHKAWRTEGFPSKP